MLSLHFLGPMKVTLDGAPLTAFEYDKVRALLIYLSVEGDRAHRRETLMGLLWPDLPETSARSNLRQALATLRRAIGDRDPAAPYLVATRESVKWAGGANSWVDVAVHTALLDESGRHAHRHPDQCRTCAARLEEAVALYRGAFLAQFSIGDSTEFEEWALLKREWIHHRQLAALAQLVTYYEKHADYARAIEFARRQLELDAWREECHRRLMGLLVLNGERGAALDQYERCCRLLEQQLGVEPEEATTALYRQIRDQPPDAPVSIRDLRPATLYAQNLPSAPTPFIGRETELEQLTALLDDSDSRLITLVGIGGVGKTRLALQAAQAQVGAFADGVFWIPLVGVSNAERVPQVISDAVGLVGAGSTNPATHLLDSLRGKEMLLVLDNFEHLPEATPFVSRLLGTAPGVSLLVTSRERLRLSAECVMDIGGLQLPTVETQDASDAVALFVRVAQRARGVLTGDDNERAAITRICELVEGLPLGIELAAAWMHLLPAEEIAAEIERDLAFLTASLHDVPARHHSLEAVFDHSWRLLSEPEQRVLAALALFRGGFRRDAAEATAGATLVLLSDLINKSLVRRDPTGRYDLHEVVRQYAMRRLTSTDGLPEARNAFLDFYVRLAEQAEAQFSGGAQAEWLDRVAVEYENFTAALEGAVSGGAAEPALRLAAALFRYWQWRTQIGEGRRWLETVLEATEAAPDEFQALRARLLHAAGVLADEQGDYASALRFHERALALRTALGDIAGQAASLNSLGILAWERQEYDRAQEHIEESLRLRRMLGNAQALANPLNNLGLVALARRDFTAAQAAFEEVLALDRATGNQIGAAEALVNLGTLMLDREAPDAALPCFRESLALYRPLDEREGIAYCLEGLAGAYAASGEQAAAVLGARISGAAARLRAQIQMPLSATERGRYEAQMAALRDTLGSAVFADAFASGEQMGWEQVLLRGDP